MEVWGYATQRWQLLCDWGRCLLRVGPNACTFRATVVSRKGEATLTFTTHSGSTSGPLPYLVVGWSYHFGLDIKREACKDLPCSLPSVSLVKNCTVTNRASLWHAYCRPTVYRHGVFRARPMAWVLHGRKPPKGVARLLPGGAQHGPTIPATSKQKGQQLSPLALQCGFAPTPFLLALSSLQQQVPAWGQRALAD